MKFSFSHRIKLIEGSSESPVVVDAVKEEIGSSDRVAIFLDSNHSHKHVLTELRLYGGLVSKGQHLTVYATAIARMPISAHRPRSWGPEANPMTALQAYLNESDRFVIDAICERKSLVSFAPGGRLLCVK